MTTTKHVPSRRGHTWLMHALLASATFPFLFLNAAVVSAAGAEADSKIAAFVQPLPQGAMARFGVTRFRAAGQLYGLKLSADGRALATLNAAGTLRIWNAQTGQLVSQRLNFGRLRYDETWDLEVALSHDAKTVALSGAAGVSLREARAFEPIRLPAVLERPQRGRGIGFSSDDKAVIFGCGDGVKAFSVETGRELEDFRVPAAESLAALNTAETRRSEEGQAVAKYWSENELAPPFKQLDDLSLSADGSLLAVGAAHAPVLGNRVRLFKLVRDDENRLTVHEHLPDDGHRAGIHYLQFVGRGDRLLSTGIDNTGRLWNVHKQKRPILTVERAYRASVSDDGRWLAVLGVNSGNDVRLFDIGMADVAHLASVREGAGDVALSPAGTHLGYMQSGRPSALLIEELASGKVVHRIDARSSTAYSLLFSADGKMIARGESHPQVWDVATGKRLLDAAGGSPHTMMFTPDKRHLVCASRGKTPSGAVQVWSLATGRLVRSFGEDCSLRSGAVMHDNRRLIGGCLDGKIRVWDLQTGKLLKTLPGHRRYVTAVALAADDTKFATGCIDSEILLWDARQLPQPDALR